MGVAAVGAYGNRSMDGLWSIRWTAEAKFPMLPTLRSPTGPLLTTDPEIPDASLASFAWLIYLPSERLLLQVRKLRAQTLR
jgi:hypothetical protein